MEESSYILLSKVVRLLTTAVWLALVLALISLDAASQTTPVQQVANQDCEKIKQDIQQLQQDLANLSVEMQHLTQLLDQVNQDVSKTEADLKTATGLANAGITNETIRGQLLDTLAKLLSTRRQIKQQLEDDASVMQEIKNEIADLLNKLANCAPPSTTEPPKGTPGAQPVPPSNPLPPSPLTPTPLQQPPGQDCAKIKQDIQQLQQDLANLSVEMQHLTELLDQVNQDVSKTEADLKTATGLANAGITNETVRGQLLDTLAKLLSTRRQIKQQLEDDASVMQEIKNEIADLLNKLANCAPPSTTEPPKGTPAAQPVPPSNPLPPSPLTPTPLQQPPGQDCAKIKQDIQQLQQDLANLSVEMQHLTELLDQVNQDVSKTEADLKTATGLANVGITNETVRGQLLDTLAKLLSTRRQIKQQLEDDASVMQEIKNEIADLLNKLANCAPPSTTEPPKGTPAAQPVPP